MPAFSCATVRGWLVLLILLSSGCAAPTDDAPPTDEAPHTGEVPAADGAPPATPGADDNPLPILSYAECNGFEVVQSMRSADATPHMPPGFTPRDILLEQDEVGTLVTQVGVCGEVAVGGMPASTSGAHGFAILLAHPPAELEDPTVSIHAVALHFVVGGDEELAPLVAAGLDTGRIGDGNVQLEIQGGAATGDGTLEAEGFSLSHAGGGAIQAHEGYRVRFYNLTGDPILDAVLQDFQAGIGGGHALVEGVDVPSSGAGYSVLRLAGGPFVEFHPIV